MPPELIPVAILVTYVGFAVAETLRPARAFPNVARWRLKGVAFFFLGIALTAVIPPIWDAWLGDYRLVDATSLGTWVGGLYGFIVLELGVYVWHRSLHTSKLLWRVLHQMHHSAERVDIWGSLYFNPLDLLAFAFVYSFALVVVAGVTPEAALVANLTATFCSFFQHANIRTPAWLGYIIQRPEAHSLHHERGVHAYNYSDFAVWDIVFGTWKNPSVWNAEAGFYDGASKRIAEMLIGLDVSAPRMAAGEREKKAAPEDTLAA